MGPDNLPRIPSRLLTSRVTLKRATSAKRAAGDRGQTWAIIAVGLPCYLYAPSVGKAQKLWGLETEATFAGIFDHGELARRGIRLGHDDGVIVESGPHADLKFRVEGSNGKQLHHSEVALRLTTESLA